jgi:hypothetical protein
VQAEEPNHSSPIACARTKYLSCDVFGRTWFGDGRRSPAHRREPSSVSEQAPQLVSQARTGQLAVRDDHRRPGVLQAAGPHGGVFWAARAVGLASRAQGKLGPTYATDAY